MCCQEVYNGNLIHLSFLKGGHLNPLERRGSFGGFFLCTVMLTFCTNCIVKTENNIDKKKTCAPAVSTAVQTLRVQWL